MSVPQHTAQHPIHLYDKDLSGVDQMYCLFTRITVGGLRQKLAMALLVQGQAARPPIRPWSLPGALLN